MHVFLFLLLKVITAINIYKKLRIPITNFYLTSGSDDMVIGLGTGGDSSSKTGDGGLSFDFTLKNSVSFFGDGCGVITLESPIFELKTGLVEIVSRVDKTGCFEEKITKGEMSVIDGGGVASFALLNFAASNASNSFCDVNVVTLLSIGVEGGVSSFISSLAFVS